MVFVGLQQSLWFLLPSRTASLTGTAAAASLTGILASRTASRIASRHMLGWLAAYKYVSPTPQVGMAFE